MRRGTVGLAASTVLAVALPLLGASPASATATAGTVSVSAAAAEAICAAPASGAARTTAPAWRRHADSPRVTEADRRALPPVSSGSSGSSASSEASLMRAASAMPDRVRIPVHVNLVTGAHRGDKNRSRAAVDKWIARMNKSFAGQQSSLGPGTRYRFWKASVRTVKKDSWYHAVPNSRADREMRTKLRRGGAHSLNLYITRPGSDVGILGFARFPWQHRKHPRLDGVTVSVDALPGGRAVGYNTGDTLVHEVGHWMGLFHTFEGGCTSRNDHVADTPAEAEPSFKCQDGRDTCKRVSGKDPVRNFMDYSYDTCMNHFTQGQVDRMDLAWFRYRHKS